MDNVSIEYLNLLRDIVHEVITQDSNKIDWLNAIGGVGGILSAITALILAINNRKILSPSIDVDIRPYRTSVMNRRDQFYNVVLHNSSLRDYGITRVMYKIKNKREVIVFDNSIHDGLRRSYGSLKTSESHVHRLMEFKFRLEIEGNKVIFATQSDPNEIYDDPFEDKIYYPVEIDSEMKLLNTIDEYLLSSFEVVYAGKKKYRHSKKQIKQVNKEFINIIKVAYEELTNEIIEHGYPEG